MSETVNGSASAASLKKTVAALIAPSGTERDLEIDPLSGGGNNRVFLLTSGEQRYVVKVYFRDHADGRDRLHSEHSFLSFAWGSGVRSVPEPIARDEEAGIGVCRFIDGSRPAPGEIGGDHLQQAFGFVQRINLHRASRAALDLPYASEACLSVADHIATVDLRVDRLMKMPVADGRDEAALRFVLEELDPCRESLREGVRSACRRSGIDVGRLLTREELLISPSDFGFHNAIAGKDGTLVFIDFEYAGWDDPAKMICDFFCQEAVPAPPDHFDDFSGAVTAGVSSREDAVERASLLMPLYRLKWCCIVLNHFLPVDRKRRVFARQHADEMKGIQLGKAKALFARLQSEFSAGP